MSVVTAQDRSPITKISSNSFLIQRVRHIRTKTDSNREKLRSGVHNWRPIFTIFSDRGSDEGRRWASASVRAHLPSSYFLFHIKLPSLQKCTSGVKLREQSKRQHRTRWETSNGIKRVHSSKLALGKNINGTKIQHPEEEGRPFLEGVGEGGGE